MEKRINHFIKFAVKELKLSKVPKINLVGHQEDKKRSFGDFRKDSDSIRVRVVGRHPLDVMRTLAHELVHHKQGSSKSEQFKEDQANALAGRLMKKYDEQNPKLFNEDAVASSVLPGNNIGSGNVETFSPLLGAGKKKDEKRSLMSRISPSASLEGKAGEKGKSLRDIVGKNKVDKDMKKEKKFINPFGA